MNVWRVSERQKTLYSCVASVTLGVIAPILALIMAAFQTVMLSRRIKKLAETGMPESPDPESSANDSSKALRSLIMMAWATPVLFYLFLNVFTDLGQVEIF
jgi:hypothetical protein